MSASSGFIYLNAANQWPSFARHWIDITPDGSLSLAKIGGVFVPRGIFRGGPFYTPDGATPWFRLLAEPANLPAGTHVQFFTFAGDLPDAPYDPTADNPFSDPRWLPVTRDVLDLLVLNQDARKLWIGGVMRTEASDSPSLQQMRLEYGRDTYLNFLPTLYRTNGPQSEFLERFLALQQSTLSGLERSIADLPLLFDPWAAPDGNFPSWLGWLSGWLTFLLDENWTEPQMRKYLAEAFELHQERGTIEGLRRYLKLYGGVAAHIQEPALQTSLWSLGETSLLGFTTMLAPGSLQGAVLGTSATLDQSNLTEAVDFGAALFDDVAHRFCIQVYCAELNRPGALDAVRAVIAREKPAHTDCHVCVIEPRLLIGLQARIGIDSIVGNGPPLAEVGKQLDTRALADQQLECYS
jgi:phage tail-like protein